ncbi:MAG: hypothetical protein ACI9OH_000903 [Oleispira sp.]|jgi:hypothetical protein
MLLNKVCIKEGVALVNIVRKQEQVPIFQVKGYGGLDFSPTLLNRAFGMTWSVVGC